MLLKKNVYYSQADSGDECRNCRHFVPHNRCEIVYGDINPEYWCIKHKVNEDARSSE